MGEDRLMPDDLLADGEACYRAVAGRDPRFDGRLYLGVTSTGIYCRPSCPARTPRPENVRFYASAAAAVAAGFRACKRCRPDALPGSRAWDHRADLAARALRLIAAGEVDEHGVAGLAARLHVSERHLHRTLVTEVGAGPLALARSRRAQTARLLVDQTGLPLADVAFAAGFASVRQFNDVMRKEFGCPPSALRRGRGTGPEDDRLPSAGSALTLRLVHRDPYQAASLLGWLAARSVAGVESTAEGGHARVLRSPAGPMVVQVAPGPGHWTARLWLPDLAAVAPAVTALRRLLDLDADPAAVDPVLAADPGLASLVALRPGLRVPGTVDGFELGARAVLGQQVTLAGARTLAGRLVAALGEPLPSSALPGLTHAFPTADAVAEADLGAVGLTAARRAALHALATAVADGTLRLDPGADRRETRARLLALPGVGPWTAEYVALRALADPDSWPGTDLVLRREVACRAADPERWRPWRGYGALHLWVDAADRGGPTSTPLQPQGPTHTPEETA